jgi:Amt family ammonium transporter
MKQILIVDDYEMSVLFLKISLPNYDVVSATNGNEMWTQLSKNIPDLILMDVVMPEEDGYQLAQKLAIDEKYKDIPIIFQSAKITSEDLNKGFKSGAVDYIRKPVDGIELNARIESVLKIKDLENKLNASLNLIRLDMKLARQIQSKIIPLKSKIRNGLHFHIKYLPMLEVGGDFFYLSDIESGVTRIFLADVTGHGIQSALITMLIKCEFENLVNRIKTPSELLFILNNIFVSKYRDLNIFFPCILIDINLNENKIIYSSAGHTGQMLISEKSINFLNKTGRITGITSDAKYTQVEYEFKKGDRLYIFTDGIYEEFNEKDKMYGEERVYKSLEDNNRKGLIDNIEFLLSDLMDFMGNRTQEDDITLIGIEIAP